MSGPMVMRADAGPDCCGRCGKNFAVHNLQRVPRNLGGGQIFLCTPCDAASKHVAPPAPRQEAGTFGPAMNAVIMLRQQAATGVGAEPIAQRIVDICRTYRAQASRGVAPANFPALAYVGNPAGLLDVFIPNPPSQAWKDRCLEALRNADFSPQE